MVFQNLINEIAHQKLKSKDYKVLDKDDIEFIKKQEKLSKLNTKEETKSCILL